MIHTNRAVAGIGCILLLAVALFAAARSRTTPVATAPAAPSEIPSQSAEFDWRTTGQAVYAQYCQACHGAVGDGRPGFAPPVAGLSGRIYRAAGGPEYLAAFLLWGLAGEITIDGISYRGSHPPFGRLSDTETAALLNQMLSGFEASGTLPAGEAIYRPEDVAGWRTPRLTPEEVHALRPDLNRN